MKIFISIIVALVSMVLIVLVVFAGALMALPDVHELETCFVTTMYEVKLCPGSPDYAKLEQISPYVVHAVIAAEDGTFYSHDGFDWHEIQESLTADLHSGHIRRGGSTLTQQLAKNVFLGKEKSLWRKVKEAYLAHAIEKNYHKDFILEKYLNVVEFGAGLYGVKDASEHYFHKPPSELNPLEAAFLAFLLPNPKAYSKNYSVGKLTTFARRMVAVILKRMASYGKLSPEALSVAMANIDNFPWSGLSSSAFSGRPTYSLDATAPAKGSLDNEVIPDADSGGEEPTESAAPPTRAVTPTPTPAATPTPVAEPAPSTDAVKPDRPPAKEEPTGETDPD